MPRRLALAIALALTVVVGFALLSLGAVDFGSDGGTTSGAEVASATTDGAAAPAPAQSTDALVTPVPSAGDSEQDSPRIGDDDHEDEEHERFEEDDHEGGEREHERH